MPQVPCMCGKSFWAKEGRVPSHCPKCIRELGGSNRTTSRQFFHKGKKRTIVHKSVIILAEALSNTET